MLHQRLAAMMAGTQRNALLTGDLRQVMRMYAIDRERNDPRAVDSLMRHQPYAGNL